jgi:hypothetical protein
MATGRERMADLRWRRRMQDIRQVTVWLDQDSLDRLSHLRRPGEHDSEVVRRALQALEVQEASGHPAVPRAPTPARPVTSDVTSDRPTPDRDAALLARLQRAQQETPPPTYQALAAETGIPEGTVKRKAAQWTREGRLAPRPRGGARPRKGHHDRA